MSTRRFARNLALLVASLLAGVCTADYIVRYESDAPSRTPVKMAPRTP